MASSAGGGGAAKDSAAGASAGEGPEKPDALIAKKLARLEELQQTYCLVRSLPYKLAVVLKLNYVPPPPPVVEEVVEQVVPDPKAAKVDPKKKGKK